jgi:beta-glucanase (GH16 family)
MKTLAFFLLLFTFFCSAASNKQTKQNSYSKEKPIEWVLDWEDQFNQDGLPNPAIWSYEVGKIRNNEAQFYTKARLENARVENGMLLIEARKDNFDGNEITSASIHTSGKKSMLYGKIEVRAKVPEGRGSWPAIWMLGESKTKKINWPECGEIDIMENVGYDPDKVHFNVHTKAYNHVMNTNKGKIVPDINPSQDFHIYAVEWYTNRIDFFLDGTKQFTFMKEEGNDKWPFDKSQYLILNLAIGGAWGGQKGIDDTKFPFKYYIDYVKVYKQKE